MKDAQLVYVDSKVEAQHCGTKSKMKLNVGKPGMNGGSGDTSEHSREQLLLYEQFQMTQR